jgi:hypothetical protein
MLTIELFASPHVEYKHLEFIPVHVIVQLAWLCHALYMQLGRSDERRAGTANAEWPLCGRRGPTREVVNDGGDGRA